MKKKDIWFEIFIIDGIFLVIIFLSPLIGIYNFYFFAIGGFVALILYLFSMYKLEKLLHITVKKKKMK